MNERICNERTWELTLASRRSRSACFSSAVRAALFFNFFFLGFFVLATNSCRARRVEFCSCAKSISISSDVPESPFSLFLMMATTCVCFVCV